MRECSGRSKVPSATGGVLIGWSVELLGDMGSKFNHETFEPLIEIFKSG